jgi:hypothetical protein
LPEPRVSIPEHGLSIIEIGRCPKMCTIVGLEVINYEINSLCYQSSVATSQADPSASPLD